MVVKQKAQVNPYIAGNPISENFGFFGRTDILQQIEDTLASPGQNAVILFGQRRIGKTSILLQSKRSLPDDQYIIIYQDLQDKAGRSMGMLLKELANEITGVLKLDNPNLSFDDQGQVFQHQFLPQIYAALPNETQRLVLLLDEFDTLDPQQRDRLSEGAAAKQIFPALRRWMREEPRLAFVFALGRNLGDLNAEFLSTFKSSQTVRVSIFSREETVDLITAPRERLTYTDDAVERIYALTNGHPYFTQLLCSLCFDKAYSRFEESSPEPPIVTRDDVENLVPLVLSRGANVGEWIWDGLPLVEQIVTLTLAELLTNDKPVATEAEIEMALRNERVRMTPHDLQVSVAELVEWQLLQRVDQGYRFLVPLLYLWIRENKDLANLQEKMDQVDRHAQRYFELAEVEFRSKDLKAAQENLERALAHNPDHLQAQLLIGELYLDQDRLVDALDYFVRAYRRNKGLLKSKLSETLTRLENDKQSWETDDLKVMTELLGRLQEVDPQFDVEPYFQTIMGVRRQNLYRRVGTIVISLLIVFIVAAVSYLLTKLFAIPVSLEISSVAGLLPQVMTGQVSPENNTLGVGLALIGIFGWALITGLELELDFRNNNYSITEFFQTMLKAILIVLGITTGITVLYLVGHLIVQASLNFESTRQGLRTYFNLDVAGAQVGLGTILILLLIIEVWLFYWIFNRGMQILKSRLD